MAAKSVNKPPFEDEISLHRKGWVIQRVGWLLLFVFLGSAVLGLYGEGPLSNQKQKVGNIQVEYERFCRYEHGMAIRFESDIENISHVSIPQNYLRNFRLDEVIPEPKSQVASAGYIDYQFEGDRNQVVTFYMNPVRSKSVEGVFRVNRNPFTIKQTIYP